MLEVFFDNEKTFSFFDALVQSEKKEVDCFRILYNLGVAPEAGSDILKAFVFLDILEETNDLENGIFKFNKDAPITLLLYFLNDFIEKYCQDAISNKGEEDNEVSFRDFLKFVEETHEEISLKEMIDLLKENGSL